MNPTRHDLPGKARSAMIELLNRSLAEAIDLWAQAKQSHWNVKGPNFAGLHQLFDSVAEKAEEFADDLAERAVSLGGTAEGALPVVVERSRIDGKSPHADSAKRHVEAVADALAKFGKHVRKAIDTAAEAGDQGTADLFTGVSRDADKLLWMVEAHLGK